MPPMRMAFVDLETTGATATADRITEIGVVEIDDDGSREWSSLVNPQARIPEFIERLTGISNAMVATAPTFAELAGDLAARLDGQLFVAHNARFDYSFLKAEFARVGIEFRATVLCTVKLSRRLFPEHRKHNLDSLIERHGLSVDQRHRALGDARAIAQFWQGPVQEVDAEMLAAAVKALTARPSIPAHLGGDDLDALPAGPGVYLFYGENELPIYVGKSKTLRKRILAHFAADHSSDKEMGLAQQVRQIDCIETAGEIGALLTEARLIKQLQPTMNRQLRRNDDLCAWQFELQPVAGAVLTPPRLVRAVDIEFGRQHNLFGLFKTSRDATGALRAMADEHGLCHAWLGLEKLPPGRPCFSHQLHKCHGLCVGKETVPAHALRLLTALTKLKLASWPFPGPALLREGTEIHVIDAWCHLGTARSENELHEVLETGTASFDRDTYLILRKLVAHMTPL
jgi:DNA polymerase-3 subunit epsilon